MSLSSGGVPVRSRLTLRIRACLVAGGAGSSPAACRRLKTKLSTGLAGQPGCSTAGTALRRGGRNAQWPCHSAPSSIHWRSSSISRLDSGSCPMAAGGMRLALSEADTRRNNSLLPGSPGTMALRPPLSAVAAPCSSSSRSDVIRLASSGPWQAKQFSDRIGRMSRLNCTVAPASGNRIVPPTSSTCSDETGTRKITRDYTALGKAAGRVCQGGLVPERGYSRLLPGVGSATVRRCFAPGRDRNPRHAALRLALGRAASGAFLPKGRRCGQAEVLRLDQDSHDLGGVSARNQHHCVRLG